MGIVISCTAHYYKMVSTEIQAVNNIGVDAEFYLF